MICVKTNRNKVGDNRYGRKTQHIVLKVTNLVTIGGL